MNLSALIHQFRRAAFDREEPYLFETADIIDWLNEAEEEAAIRGRLIHEAENLDVCVISIVPGVTIYPLHPSIYEIECAHYTNANRPTDQPCRLYQVSQEDLAAKYGPSWRTYNYTNTDPQYLVQQDTGIRIVPAPKYAGVINIEGYRKPINPMVDDDDTPEINEIHHKHLVEWALYKGFSVPDSEVFDPTKADKAEMVFTDYFGERPSSNLRRRTREDVPHTVKPFWV